MADYSISNEKISIIVSEHGAELRSIKRLTDGREYMWCGDAKYWNRVSPVLFPFVGKLKDQSYKYKGQVYSGVPQHGYARDCDFAPAEKSEDTLWFELKADEFWKEKYPFDFLLRIGYRIDGYKVYVMWDVKNLGNEEMYFSIGAHPAFYCGINASDFVKENGKEENTADPKIGAGIDFNKDIKTVRCDILNDKGVLGDRTKDLILNKGILKITEGLFEEDALIMESGDLSRISLLDKEGKAYLNVSFNAPMLGIWSPVGKNAPFVCIEPWYGRCDRFSFDKELQDREYGNSVAPGESFAREYIIEITEE